MKRGRMNPDVYRTAYGPTLRLAEEHGRDSRSFLSAAAGESREYKAGLLGEMLGKGLTRSQQNQVVRIANQMREGAGLDATEDYAEAARNVTDVLSHPENEAFARQVLTDQRVVKQLDSTSKRFFQKKSAHVFFRAARGATGIFSRVFKRGDAGIELAGAILGALEARMRGGGNNALQLPVPADGAHGGAASAAAAGVAIARAGGNGVAAAAAAAASAAGAHPALHLGPDHVLFQRSAGGSAVGAVAAAAAAGQQPGVTTMFGLQRPVPPAQALVALQQYFAVPPLQAVRVFEHVRKGLDEFAGETDLTPEHRKQIGDTQVRNSHVTNLLVAADGFVHEVMSKGFENDPHSMSEFAKIAGRSTNLEEFQNGVKGVVKAAHRSIDFLHDFFVKPNEKLFDHAGREVELKHVSAHNVHRLYTKDATGNLHRLEREQVQGLAFYVLGQLAARGNPDNAERHVGRFVNLVTQRRQNAEEAWRNLQLGRATRQQVMHLLVTTAHQHQMSPVDMLAFARALRGQQGGGH